MVHFPAMFDDQKLYIPICNPYIHIYAIYSYISISMIHGFQPCLTEGQMFNHRDFTELVQALDEHAEASEIIPQHHGSTYGCHVWWLRRVYPISNPIWIILNICLCRVHILVGGDWNFFHFSIQLGMSSSQVTFIFLRWVGIPPDT